MSTLLEAGLMNHDEGFAAGKCTFETKEEFLSAIILHQIYFYDGHFNDVFKSDISFELELEKRDVDLELDVIKSGFLRSCVCTGWEDWDGDGRRAHWEQTANSKGGGSPAWLYDYYDIKSI